VEASDEPTRADVDGQTLEFYSFLLACRSFESPEQENDSKGAAEPSSMTRLIEEASRGRKFSGFTNMWCLLPRVLSPWNWR